MKFFFITFFLFISLSIFAQTGKQQATEIVMNSVVGTHVDNIDVFADSSLQISPYYRLSQYDSIASPYSSYWLYFIDDHPYSNWGHDCRYVFVNSVNGAVSIVDAEIPPFGYRSMLESVSISSVAPTCNEQCATHFQTIVPNADVNDNKFALLIAGPDCGTQLVKFDFWNAISHTYCSLLEHGYKKNNIYALVGDGTASSNAINCLDLDGQGDNDILPLCCSVEYISNTINSIKQNIQPSDILYVGICCHGAPYGTNGVRFNLWNDEQLCDTVMANLLSGIECSQIIFNIQSCFSGGFADELENLNTTAKTSYICSVNVEQPYLIQPSFILTTGLDEFCYFSISSLRETYPSIDSVWVQADSVGHHNVSNWLYSKYEKDFDSLVNGGNQDGVHEFGETIRLAKEYDDQFNAFGAYQYDCGFMEDLLTLTGIGGYVDSCQSVSGDFHVERKLTVRSDSLTLLAGTGMYLFNTDLEVLSNSKLILEDTVSIIAKTGRCRVILGGETSFGHYLTFRAEEGATLEVIFNEDRDLDLEGVTFENCTLSLPSKSISITDCVFLGTPITANINPDILDAFTFAVDNCRFSPLYSDLSHAIYIGHYKNYSVKNCQIGENGYQFMEGISVLYCGSDSIGIRIITRNSVSDCTDAGIVMYHSAGNITMNEICHNRIGIKLLNNCNIGRISGDCQATDPSMTQYIHNNADCEIYITDCSLPNRMRYNVINHTGEGCWIRHESSATGDYPLHNDTYIDFRYNQWGNGITPSTQFYTDSGRDFAVVPTWVMGQCYNEQTDGLDLLDEADSLLARWEYGPARTLYRQIITDYPETTVSSSAALSLLEAERAVGGDIETLQDYYLTDGMMNGDPTLSRLGKCLANDCAIALGNYDEAFNWYEKVIEDPSTGFNDSLFATIDQMNLAMELAHNDKGYRVRPGVVVPMNSTSAANMEQRMISSLPYAQTTPSIDESEYDRDYLPCRNLQAVFNGETTLLSWELPEIQSSEMRLSWANDMEWSGCGVYADHEQADVAHRFDTSELKPFIGWRVKDISMHFMEVSKIYETDYAKIWHGVMLGPNNFEAEVVYESPGFKHMEENSWITITLDTNVYITEGEELWIGYTDVNMFYSYIGFSADCYPAIHYKGNLIRPVIQHPNFWYGPLSNNWLISATIVSPDGTQQSLNSYDKPQLTGCVVRRNGEIIDTFHQPERIYYEDTRPGEGMVEYCVSMIYDDDCESEPVCVTVEILDTPEQSQNPIHVFPNPARETIHVEGCEVYEIQVFDHLGHHVESLIGSNQINVSDYAAGLYTLKVISNQGCVIQRVVVE